MKTTITLILYSYQDQLALKCRSLESSKHKSTAAGLEYHQMSWHVQILSHAHSFCLAQNPLSLPHTHTNSPPHNALNRFKCQSHSFSYGLLMTTSKMMSTCTHTHNENNKSNNNVNDTDDHDGDDYLVQLVSIDRTYWTDNTDKSPISI